ncbi:MAG: ribosome small subunit-dependent GTPase A [Proteobacteria bacterium]|nr:ribosome small subunit-dependent GTPase A [Pseudomonadota bacterium]
MVKRLTLNQSLGLEQPGRLIAHYGTTVIVENQAGQLYRCRFRQNLGTLVTGDEILWQPIDDETGVVVACQTRRSTISRPDKHSTKPIASNVDVLIVVLALEPLPRQTTLDRYLILAQSLNLEAIIVINKCDLAYPEAVQMLRSQSAIYQQLGYTWLEVSSHTGEGIAKLAQILIEKTGILMGQSGVGKSSLLNVLVPNAKAQTQELSKLHRAGRHTTTTTRLYHIPNSGQIIDSPGIQAFNLRHLDKLTVLAGFKEFLPFINQCKFRNCGHLDARVCALQEASKLGKIAPFRLENYHTLINELVK